MQIVLFNIINTISHINSSLILYEYFLSKNYTIIYISNYKTKTYLDDLKIKNYPCTTYNFGMNWDVELLKNDNKINYFQVLKSKLKNDFYTKREHEICKIVEEIKPNIIINDSYKPTDFIILYNYIIKNNVQFIFLQTMLSTNICLQVPNILSKTKSSITLYVIFENLFLMFKNSIINFINKIIYFRYDDYSIVNKYISQNKLNKNKFKLTNKLINNYGFTNVLELVNAPLELEHLYFKKKSNQIYLGLNIFKQNKLNFYSIEKIVEIYKSKNQKIIYLSFGTIAEIKKNTILNNIELVCNWIINNNFKIFIHFNFNYLHLLSKKFLYHKNIHFFEFLPQIFLLQNVILFITHGGLNSIKESIYYEVPMLLMPQHLDNFSNANKIVKKGFGLQLNNKDKELSKIKKLDTLINNYQYFKLNLSTFNKTIINKYNLNIILDNVFFKKNQKLI